MSRSIFPSDDELPTWVHTLLCIAITLPFAVPLWWAAAVAFATGQLAPLSGPEFGQFFFGPHTLHGRAAHLAAFTLVLLGGSFVGIGFSFSRHAEGRVFLKLFPWFFGAISVAVYFIVLGRV